MNGQESKPSQKSGKQIGAENVERLRQYIDRLKSQGSRLPSHKGKPDKSAIAIASGFARLTLYNNQEAVALLNRAVEEIGLDGEAPGTDTRATHLQQQIDRRDRRVQRLEEQLAMKSAENEALRKEKRELEERLRQYSIFEETITSTGRMFRP